MAERAPPSGPPGALIPPMLAPGVQAWRRAYRERVAPAALEAGRG